MIRTSKILVAFIVWGLAIIILPIWLSLIFAPWVPGPFLPGTAGAENFGFVAVSLITAGGLLGIGAVTFGIYKATAHHKALIFKQKGHKIMDRYIELIQKGQLDAVNELLDGEIARFPTRRIGSDIFGALLYSARIWEYGMQGNINAFRESLHKYGKQIDNIIVIRLEYLRIAIDLMGGQEDIQVPAEFAQPIHPGQESFAEFIRIAVREYVTGNLDQAKTAAERLLESNRPFSKCVALFILSRIAYRRGDFERSKEYRAQMEELIPSEEMRELLANGEALRHDHPDDAAVGEAHNADHIGDVTSLPEHKPVKPSRRSMVLGILAVVIITSGIPVFLNMIAVIGALKEPKQVKPEYAFLIITESYDPDKYIKIDGNRYKRDLTELVLTQQGLTDQDLSQISQMKNLRKLDLRGNEIVSLNWMSGEMESLQELFLSDNKITDISGISCFPNLETLNLSGNQLADISALSCCTRISQINLSDNQITDISALGNMDQVLFMFLDSNPISDLTPMYHQNINMLFIRKTNITGSEIEALEKAMPATKIVTE